MAELSIIVVCYFSAWKIGGLISNINSKVDSTYEIILVNNSTEPLSNFESDLVHVVNNKENIGYGAAINVGVRVAKYRNLLILNPDVRIDSWSSDVFYYLEGRVISGVAKEWCTSVRAFPSLFYDFNRFCFKNVSRCFDFLNIFDSRISILNSDLLTTVDWVTGGFLLVTRESFNKVNGFDEQYFLFYEELDFCRRAKLLSINSSIYKNIEFTMNIGTSSSINVDSLKHRSEIESALIFHRKYSSRLGFLVFGYFLRFFISFWVCIFSGLYLLMPLDKINNKKSQFVYLKSILRGKA